MSAAAIPVAAPDQDAAPRRLHPATMVVTILRGAPSTLLGIPALLAVVGRADLPIMVAGAVAAFLIAVLVRWLEWSRFTYALTSDAVVIESGLFSRNRRTIPYERVADVGIERRPLQRLFGLAVVTLETGSAGANEGSLDSVARAEADRLRDVIRDRRSRSDAGSVAAEVDTQIVTAAARPIAAEPIFAMDSQRVLLSGLFNFSLVWIAVGVGGLQYLVGALGLDDDVIWDAVAARTGAARSLPVLVWAGAAIIGTAIVVSTGIVAGVVRTLLRDHGFRLSDEGGRFRRARGLLTRSEAIISLPRVQLATIDSGPVRRKLGWFRLRAQVLGGEGAGGRQDLAPFARTGEVDALLQALRLRQINAAQMQPVARGHVWRALLRHTAVPVVVIANASAFSPLALLATPLLLPLVATALLGRRHHRYRTAAGVLHVQRGVITRTRWIVPIARAQAVTIRRSWLQRRLGLATVVVDTAGGSEFGRPDVHDLREADAWALLADLRSLPEELGTSGINEPSRSVPVET